MASARQLGAGAGGLRGNVEGEAPSERMAAFLLVWRAMPLFDASNRTRSPHRGVAVAIFSLITLACASGSGCAGPIPAYPNYVDCSMPKHDPSGIHCFIGADRPTLVAGVSVMVEVSPKHKVTSADWRCTFVETGDGGLELVTEGTVCVEPGIGEELEDPRVRWVCTPPPGTWRIARGAGEPLLVEVDSRGTMVCP
ncbi:MAG: hypothetical protein Q8L48_12845 [Archangium sp.]|nr:hypothetical protein [Archangium sp.]